MDEKIPMLELQLTGVLCARVFFHASEIYVLAEVSCAGITNILHLKLNFIQQIIYALSIRITHLSFPHRLDNKAGRSPSQHSRLPAERPHPPRRRHHFRIISALCTRLPPPQLQTYRHVFSGRSRVLDGCEPVESVCQGWTAG